MSVRVRVCLYVGVFVSVSDAQSCAWLLIRVVELSSIVCVQCSLSLWVCSRRFTVPLEQMKPCKKVSLNVDWGYDCELKG